MSVLLLTAPRSNPEQVTPVLRFEEPQDAVNWIEANTVEIADGEGSIKRYTDESKLADFIHPSELPEGQYALIDTGTMEQWMQRALDEYTFKVLSVPTSLEGTEPFAYVEEVERMIDQRNAEIQQQAEQAIAPIAECESCDDCVNETCTKD